MIRRITTLTLFALCVASCAQNVEVVQTAKIKIKPPERINHVLEFSFDSAKLNSSVKDIIKPHVRYLIQNPNLSVLLQGSGSKEGEPEYNYTLGMMRAAAVKKLLIQLGVSERQIKTASIGESYSSFVPSRSVTITY